MVDEVDYERVVIAVEGRDIGVGFVLEPNSCEWEGDSWPITEGLNLINPDEFLGMARDIRREENGDITAEVPAKLIVRETGLINPDHGKPYMDFAAVTGDVYSTSGPGGVNRMVSKCTIREIARVPGFREGSIRAVMANPGASVLPKKYYLAIWDKLSRKERFVGETTPVASEFGELAGLGWLSRFPDDIVMLVEA